jgi:alpha-ketoglutarate-dependent taurine dioxygenase
VTICVRALGPALGGEVTGVDLSGPLDQTTVRAIAEALSTRGVLVFPEQRITDEDHVRFARCFGDVGAFRQHPDRVSAVKEIFRAGNVDVSGNLLPPDSVQAELLRLNWSWHIDSSYRAVPTKGTVLRGIEVTADGGATMFANMVAAYEALPVTMKRQIQGLFARHSFEFLVNSRGLPSMSAADVARLPPVEHPLVREHRDGRRSLFLSPPYIEAIVGWSQEDSLALVEELAGWSTQDRFTFSHAWNPHDVLMWDNEWTMHVVTPYDLARHRRVMHGTTLLGTEPVQPARVA